MNRGIKFRGWHLLEKRWVYGGVHIIADQAQIIEERRGVQNFHSEVDRESIGQYTGLKDKNGVEIYKGDVVHSAYHDTYSEIRFGIFNDPDDDGDDLGNGFYFFERDGLPDFGCALAFVDSSKFEVIGNAYENPELLEAK